MNAELVDLTNFRTTKMRARNYVYQGTITSDGKIEGDHDIPVSDERCDAINQAPEQRQERELDSHHCHPSKYEACGEQFVKLENLIEIWRLRCGCKGSWRVCQSFGEVRVVHVEVENCHRGSQTGCAESEEAIIEGEFLLYGNSDVVPSTYTDETDNEK